MSRATQPRRSWILCLSLLALALALVACSSGSSPTEPQPVTAAGGNGSDDASTGGSGSDGGGGSDGGSDDGDGGSDGSGGDDDGSGSRVGRLIVRMTDAPTDELAEVQVWVAGLKVKADGSPVEAIPTALGLYDLLTLRNGVSTILADAEVEATRYQFIEILLDEELSYVVDATTREQLPVKIPSEKVKINGGPFDVMKDGSTTVLFDFDADRSLRLLGNGRWQLKPFLQVLDVVVLGGP